MCHFYANPLSIFMSVEKGSELDWVQPEHLQGIRSLPSFQREVEKTLKANKPRDARNLIEDDKLLLKVIQTAKAAKATWVSNLLRCVHILVALGIHEEDFTGLFIELMARGIDLKAEDSGVIKSLRKMDPKQIVSAMERVRDALSTNNDRARPSNPEEDERICSQLSILIGSSQDAIAEAKDSGHTLRSKYSGQTKIVRTTVIAQKVQLSQDSAALTDRDKVFTDLVDSFVGLLRAESSCRPASSVFLHETWLYNSRAPYRDVFVPKPRAVFERGLARPRDYLACECCDDEGGASPAAPPASIVYRLYEEAGALINVADMWTAFYGIVGEEDGEDGDGLDERGALAMFYQGLAELKALGFVKASKKKADHVAKVKWL